MRASAARAAAQAPDETAQTRLMLSALRVILQYLQPYRAQVWLLLAGLLIDLAWAVLFGMSFQYIVDEAIAKHDETLLWTVLIGLVAAALISAMAAIGRDYLYARLGTSVMNDLRLRMFEHLQRLSAGYYSKIQIGDIMSRFSTDLAAVQNAVILAIPETILGTLGLVTISTLLFIFSWQLALVTVLGLPLAMLGPRILGPRAERDSYLVRHEEAKIASTVQENVSAQPVIRAFSLAPLQLGAFRSQLRSFYKISLRFNVLAYLVERTPNLAFLLLQIAVFGFGAVQCFHGKLSLGSLIAFNVLLGYLSTYVTSLTRVMPPLLLAAGGVKRIQELLDTSPQVADAPGAAALVPIADALAFADVSFSYTGEHKNLDHVSFTIRRGANVAVVGGSGSGKSTALGLIARFYDPDSGAVTLDGRDLRSASLNSLRGQLGVVFQESFLFNTTIRENIRFGRPDASDEDVEAAARAAEIHDLVVSLPDGYNTIVGERGGRLSGGQRQRVAIARAIVRDPAILLLDEATSALDPTTEAAVNSTLERLGRQRTVVSVTHRLASTVNADQILVFERGRLVEQGNSGELLAQGGMYKKLWDKQQGLVISEDGARAGIEPERLRAVPVLSSLADAMLQKLAKMFLSERVSEDRKVIREGDTTVDKFYIIARGKVAVLKRQPDGTDVQVATLQDGDHFGEVALLKDTPRNATIRTLTPCIFLTLQRRQFMELIQSDPRLRSQFNTVSELRGTVPQTFV
jgi:ATP-binding cassette subfamily B protein